MSYERRQWLVWFLYVECEIEMLEVKQKTKPPVLANRIDEFVETVKRTMVENGEQAGKLISRLWDDEVRLHFENGRTAKTIELYIMKYRSALKAEFGPKSVPLGICNMKKLRERLKRYIAAGDYQQSGIATSIEEKIEKAEGNSVGRKPTLLLKISDFVSRMNGLSRQDQMEEIWQDELLSMDGLAQTTVISYITKYRNAIREAFGESHPMLKIATGDRALYDDARKKKMAAIATKHGALITFQNYMDVLKICQDCLKSDDPLSLGIGLLGTTGRRPYEIFTQAEFSRAPYAKGVSKWSILFKGQAKTKEREGTKFGLTYEIPVLAPATVVLDAYNRLRKSGAGILWYGMSLDDFSSEIRLPLRDVVREMFANVWPMEEPPKPYGLRHLYAEIAYRNFAPRSVSKNSYFAAILGHNNNDLETSLSYMTYNLPDDEDNAAKRAERVADRTLTLLQSL